MKIVINAKYGGFSISLEAARYMAKRGNETARKEVEEYDKKVSNKELQDKYERQWGVKFFGFGYAEGSDGYKRNDPILVEAVEKLKSKANGEYAKLKVIKIPDGVNWIIIEYDGWEHVAEEHRTWS